MCFSATASLTAAAVLGATGIYALRKCPCPRMLPYAAIPMLFSVQQLAEGVLWLALAQGLHGLASAMSQAFALFAHVLWPAYIPLAVLLLEPQAGRRRLLAGLAVAGAAFAAFHLPAILLSPVDASPAAGHIAYPVHYYLAGSGMALYLAATAGGPLASSWRRVRLFGMLVVITLLFTWWAYARWLVSVWCFFAALLSTVVVSQVVATRRRKMRLERQRQAADAMARVDCT